MAEIFSVSLANTDKDLIDWVTERRKKKEISLSDILEMFGLLIFPF